MIPEQQSPSQSNTTLPCAQHVPPSLAAPGATAWGVGRMRSSVRTRRVDVPSNGTLPFRPIQPEGELADLAGAERTRLYQVLRRVTVEPDPLHNPDARRIVLIHAGNHIVEVELPKNVLNCQPERLESVSGTARLPEEVDAHMGSRSSGASVTTPRAVPSRRSTTVAANRKAVRSGDVRKAANSSKSLQGGRALKALCTSGSASSRRPGGGPTSPDAPAPHDRP